MAAYDLRTVFAGVPMRSPVGVASHAVLAPPGIDPEREAEFLLRYVDEGAGFVYTPVIRQEPLHPSGMLPKGRFLKGKDSIGRHGLYCIADRDRIQTRSESGLKLIGLLKRALPFDVPLIANMTVISDEPDDWVSHAKRLEAGGADLLELNASCPLNEGRHESQVEGGAAVELETGLIPESLGDSPYVLAEIIRAVVAAVKIPVGLKASPETGYPRLVNAAALYADAGLRFITEINSPMGLASPDIERGGAGFYPGIDENPLAGMVGPWIRHLCYRNTAAIAKWVPSLDVAAVGGLTDPKHIIEAMMLGAGVAEISSGMFFHGYRLIPRVLGFLGEYMVAHGFQTLEGFRGLGLQYVRPSSEVAWPADDVIPVWDKARCSGCGICAENLCFAISLREGKPDIKREDCGSCGLCAAVCPRGAISMQQMPPNVGWGQEGE